jgi:hypothetical protein
VGADAGPLSRADLDVELHDFQARRLRMRVREADGVTPLATLNGTLATTRWIVAILENHQQADGSVVVPQALRPFLGGREVWSPSRNDRGSGSATFGQVTSVESESRSQSSRPTTSCVPSARAS